MLLQEVSLTRTRAERDLQDSLAEVFSIIVTLDEVEKAFIKDSIPAAEYNEICERSLRQYKALLADEAIAKEFGSIEQFKAKWDVSCIIYEWIYRYTLAELMRELARGPARNRTSTQRRVHHHRTARWRSRSPSSIRGPDIKHERRAHSRSYTRIHYLPGCRQAGLSLKGSAAPVAVRCYTICEQSDRQGF